MDTLKYFMVDFSLSSCSWKDLILVSTVHLNSDFGGGSLRRQFRGSSRPYCLEICLTKMAHVLLFSVELVSRYLMMSWIFKSGFFQIE